MSGPRAKSEPAATSGPAPEVHLIRISLLILAAYLVLTLAPMLRWGIVRGSWAPAVAHVVALSVALAGAFVAGTRLRTLRDWTPLGLGPFLYIELRWIIEGVGQPHADALVVRWEATLFGSDPSRTLALLWPSLVLSELLHLCYISYYALVYVPPALLWLRGQRKTFAETVLALVIVYAVCFLVYAVFPVDGPRFAHGPSLAPAGPIRTMVVHLLETGSSRGTAFPSSHVAASVAAALCALRYQRRVGVVVAVCAVGLAIGAVYGGYHYGVDVVAGAITGGVAFAVSRVIVRRTDPSPRAGVHPSGSPQ
jgi:membrane-associated phospholipid phosphatase